jgi:hypothetical protein
LILKIIKTTPIESQKVFGVHFLNLCLSVFIGVKKQNARPPRRIGEKKRALFTSAL